MRRERLAFVFVLFLQSPGPAAARVKAVAPESPPPLGGGLGSLPLPAPAILQPLPAAVNLPLPAPVIAAQPKAALPAAALQARALPAAVALPDGAVKAGVLVFSEAVAADAGGADLVGALFDNASQPRREDLPPAGPSADLSYEQRDWLRWRLVDGPEPTLTDLGFAALVLGERSALDLLRPGLREEKHALAQTLHSMLLSLRTVAACELPPGERQALAVSLNDRFAEVLRALAEDPALRPDQRAHAALVGRRYLEDRSALAAMLHHRETRGKLARLHRDLMRHGAPARDRDVLERPWTVGPRLPAAQRGNAPDEERAFTIRMSDIAAVIRHWQFTLERTLARRRIVQAGEGRFSRRTQETVAREFHGLFEEYQRKAGLLYSRVERLMVATLPRSFVTPPGHRARIAWLPDDRNLRLSREGDGWVVRADFETDVQDDAVLQAVKASIEDYWKGGFEWKARSWGFRVEVVINKLPPGAPFSEGALRIRDAQTGISAALPEEIALDRHFAYSTPAHEFGHLMGLPDEYREVYDPASQASLFYENPASLMASQAGRVLPRHRRLVFLLLRRRHGPTARGVPVD